MMSCDLILFLSVSREEDSLVSKHLSSGVKLSYVWVSTQPLTSHVDDAGRFSEARFPPALKMGIMTVASSMTL